MFAFPVFEMILAEELTVRRKITLRIATKSPILQIAPNIFGVSLCSPGYELKTCSAGGDL